MIKPETIDPLTGDLLYSQATIDQLQEQIKNYVFMIDIEKAVIRDLDMDILEAQCNIYRSKITQLLEYVGENKLSNSNRAVIREALKYSILYWEDQLWQAKRAESYHWVNADKDMEDGDISFKLLNRARNTKRRARKALRKHQDAIKALKGL